MKTLNHWRLEHFEELGSTSDYCIERAGRGEDPYLVVWADSQTKGRGSRGRTWESGKGNLTFSFLLRPQIFPEIQCYMWPFLSGLALHMGLVDVGLHSDKIFIKWPNDIIADYAKLAGILIEQGMIDSTEKHSIRDQFQNWLVIGMGVNIQNAPSIKNKPAISLLDIGYNINPEELLQHILLNVDKVLNQLMNEGFESIKRKWVDHSVPIGYPLVVELKGVHYKGTFAGINGTGHLKLKTAHSILEFATGEILWLE